jgi:hypothetical protein
MWHMFQSFCHSTEDLGERGKGRYVSGYCPIVIVVMCVIDLCVYIYKWDGLVRGWDRTWPGIRLLTWDCYGFAARSYPCSHGTTFHPHPHVHFTHISVLGFLPSSPPSHVTLVVLVYFPPYYDATNTTTTTTTTTITTTTITPTPNPWTQQSSRVLCVWQYMVPE